MKLLAKLKLARVATVVATVGTTIVVTGAGFKWR
jgi:hypothetical protein